MSVRLARASLLIGLPEYLQSQGHSVDAILAEVDLEREQLSEPGNFISLDSHMALMESAARHCDEEALMVEVVRRHHDIMAFGAIGVLAASSENVGAALRVFERYLGYSVQEFDLSVSVEGETAFFWASTEYAPMREVTHIWTHGVAWMCQMIRILSGRNWSPRLVYLDREEPRDLEPFQSFFRAPLVFGQGKNGLTFSAETLARPIAPDLANVPARLSQALQEHYTDDFPAQVREVIHSLLTSGQCNAATVASSLGYKLRTMQRKLGGSGTSFNDQLEKVRSALAVNYLQEPQFRLTDVADLLGYSELSAFSRSFKRWYGVTPQRWKSRAEGTLQ